MSNMLRNKEQPLHNQGNATTLPRGVAVVLSSWRPLTRPPRRLWVRCWCCLTSTLNEDRHLRSWQESITTPRCFRCDECAELRHESVFRGRSPVDRSLRTGKATVPVYRRFPTPTVATGRTLPPTQGRCR